MQRVLNLTILCLLGALSLGKATYAQNVLGLPAVPQTPQTPQASQVSSSPASGPAAGSSAARKAARPAGKAVGASASASASTSSSASASAPPGPQINDVQAKAVLSGGVTLESSYIASQARVRVTSNTLYSTPEQRSTAIAAARLVQRDVRLACAKQCSSAAIMPPPGILPSGKLQFDLVIDNFPRQFSNQDMINLLLGKPLAVQSAAPAARAAEPAATAVFNAGASTAPVTATRPTTAAPDPAPNPAPNPAASAAQ